jgi:hypothetical protein
MDDLIRRTVWYFVGLCVFVVCAVVLMGLAWCMGTIMMYAGVPHVDRARVPAGVCGILALLTIGVVSGGIGHALRSRLSGR